MSDAARATGLMSDALTETLAARMKRTGPILRLMIRFPLDCQISLQIALSRAIRVNPKQQPCQLIQLSDF
jgi:hypothetical protein